MEGAPTPLYPSLSAFYDRPRNEAPLVIPREARILKTELCDAAIIVQNLSSGSERIRNKICVGHAQIPLSKTRCVCAAVKEGTVDFFYVAKETSNLVQTSATLKNLWSLKPEINIARPCEVEVRLETPIRMLMKTTFPSQLSSFADLFASFVPVSPPYATHLLLNGLGLLTAVHKSQMILPQLTDKLITFDASADIYISVEGRAMTPQQVQSSQAAAFPYLTPSSVAKGANKIPVKKRRDVDDLSLDLSMIPSNRLTDEKKRIIELVFYVMKISTGIPRDLHDLIIDIARDGHKTFSDGLEGWMDENNRNLHDIHPGMPQLFKLCAYVMDENKSGMERCVKDSKAITPLKIKKFWKSYEPAHARIALIPFFQALAPYLSKANMITLLRAVGVLNGWTQQEWVVAMISRATIVTFFDYHEIEHSRAELTEATQAVANLMNGELREFSIFFEQAIPDMKDISVVCWSIENDVLPFVPLFRLLQEQWKVPLERDLMKRLKKQFDQSDSPLSGKLLVDWELAKARFLAKQQTGSFEHKHKKQR